MTKAIFLFVAAGVCAAASAQAAAKCTFHDHETVIMDNEFPPRGTAWGKRPVRPTGVLGQNDPWSLNGGQATRVGWDYMFGFTEWTVGATGDFDGDGDCDLAWTRDVPGISIKVQMTVTMTPDGPDAHFVVPGSDAPTVDFGETWELVGSGHFLNAAGAEEPAGPNHKADVVLCDWATGQLSIWTDVEHLQGEHRVTGAAGAGARALGVADLVRPSPGTGMSEVIWRHGDLIPLSYSTFALQEGALVAVGGEQPLVSPADPNWWLRAAGDFNGDGWDDLLFQNLPHSERTVIWLMANGARLSGLFTDPNLLAFEERPPITDRPRVIVAPR